MQVGNFATEKLLDQVFMESDYMYLIEIDKENLFKKLKQFEPLQENWKKVTGRS